MCAFDSIVFGYSMIVYGRCYTPFLGQNPDEEDEPPSKGKKGGGKRKQRQTVSTFYKAQLGTYGQKFSNSKLNNSTSIIQIFNQDNQIL